MERVNFPALSALFGLLRLTNAVLGDGRKTGLEIRARHVGADVQVARLEMESRPFRRRELQLGFGYGLVKLVAQIRFDQVSEILNLLRSLGVPHELTQFAEGAGVFEKREPVPLREGGVIV